MQLIDFAKIKVSCENCSLSELCLPRGLSGQDLEKLDQVVKRTRPLHKGDILFRSGDTFRSLYAVRSGCVKLHASSDLGEEQIIGFYLPGEVVGMDGMDNNSHSCTATALETTSLCALPYSSLTDICKKVPTLNEQMFQLMARELSQDNQLLLTITKKNADERIATFLLSLSVRFKRLGYSATEFKLSMSRSEIGNYLGLTIETVSRGMNKFQKQGLIRIERKFVNILDMEALKSVCSHSMDAPDEKDSVARNAG
jgi:CRP/FNR family transcriptional regulator